MQKGRLSVDVHDILVIELEPGHGIAGFQMLRLFCWRPIHSIRLWQCAKACGFRGHWYTQKGFRVENGMVHMAFGGKVDHGVVPIGIEGMRKAKRSYNPVKMIEKYLISTRDLREEKGIWGKEEA